MCEPSILNSTNTIKKATSIPTKLVNNNNNINDNNNNNNNINAVDNVTPPLVRRTVKRTTRTPTQTEDN
jgi:hypothetical protein